MANDNWASQRIEFARNGDVFISFDSYEQARDWAARQWSQIQPIINAIDEGKRRSLSGQWSAITTEINQLDRKNFDNSKAVQLINNFKHRCSTLFSLFGVGDTPSINKLIDLKERYSFITAAAYWSYLAKLNWQGKHENESILGVVIAMMESGDLDHESMNRSDSSLIAKQANEAKENFESWIGNAKRDYVEVVEQTSKLGLKLDKRAKDTASWIASFKSSAAIDRDELLERGRRDLDNIRKTYNEELALRSPTSYWRTRQKFHADLAKKFAIGFVITLLVSALLIVVGSILLLIPVEEFAYRWLGLTATGSVAPPITKTVVFAALLAIDFWVLRIIYRNMVSNQHLAADAAERIVIMMTYLSLLRRKQLPSEASLDMVLAALFRSASDGLVKDDQGPVPPLWEMLMSRNK
ncbi:MAG: hypothetical protein H6815_03725 [Phycisphaeraceae bacterium]|nr:hypothetical protein [Phycisphaerales bacterium]MCB9859538.1 hypothetical protein [Phycisphaeraceae bacterium]